jgi:hypothetical protein
VICKPAGRIGMELVPGCHDLRQDLALAMANLRAGSADFATVPLLEL